MSKPIATESQIRAIANRRRLAEALPRMELAVLAAMHEAGIEYLAVGPYALRAEPGGLDIIERIPIPDTQLPLFGVDELSARRA
ncbi:MAG: hypothetical protein QM328_15530 [Acidobacteriota bacterium]|nr:hypothetical protein [Acidobacteriota bacterium]